MDSLDCLEEGLGIIRKEPRVWKGGLTKNMVSEQYGVKQAMSELRIGSNFHNISN